MSLQSLTNFLTVSTPANSVEYRFQNSQVGSSINFSGFAYNYLSFIYQGAAKNRTGDNLISALVMAVNPLSMSYAHQAIEDRWNIRVDTCLMNDDFTDIQRILTTEYWIAASMGYDTSSVEIALSSSLNAISLVLPNRVFTTCLVGFLPSTGNIQAR